MIEKIPTIGKITPYEYQWKVIESVKEHVREQWRKFPEKNKIEHAIVDAYVSAGKTIMIGAIAKHCVDVGGKIMILSRQGELVEQDSDECWNMECKNSIFSASLDRKSTRFNCVVGTEGTVANHLDTDFSKWIPNIILIDEAHHLPVDDVVSNGETQYSKIINHFIGLNERLVVIGFTGTPYRGVTSIVGTFWSKILEPRIGREFLVENGYIVPTVFGFGHDDVQYDLSEFKPKNEHGTEDFSSSELAAMEKKMDLTATQRIMMEVIELTKNRNSVMITCASERHCKQAASVLPDGTWGIITQSTGFKSRKKILDGLKDGSIKYVLQIGVLTTGLNRPLIDTSVILRRIGSLTLLVQLLGRGMRLLKKEHEEAGFEKHEHLCLDYSGTMDEMAQLYNDPILEQAQLDKAKRDHSTIACPRCGTENADTARRCIGTDLSEPDGRCGFFWAAKECPKCGTENDQSAQVCRNPSCRHELIDPNEKLRGKHYTDDDWKPVKSMELVPTGNGGILVIYNLDCMDHEDKPEVAKLFFHPWSSQQSKKIWERNFVWRHINGWPMRKRFASLPSAKAVIGMKAMLGVPTHITHRTNDKGYSVVHGLRFRDGREMLGGKESTQECNIESNQ